MGLILQIFAGIGVTGLIAAAQLLLAIRCGATGVVGCLLLTVLFTCAQIVMSEIILGVAGQLHPAGLVLVNGVVSLAIMGGCCRQLSASRTVIAEAVRTVRSLPERLGEQFSRENVALLLPALFTLLWLILATVYLPPRGIDDLTYHLPPLFEYIATGRIALLPVDLRIQFAYPQNAELLFLWPTIFLHSQRFVDGINLFFILLAVAIVYGLARETGRTPRESLFLGLLFFFTPVVLVQGGSNYIDLIGANFFLAALYCTVRFLRWEQPLFAHGAAVAIGLGCGMKYTMPFLFLPLLLVMLPKLARQPKRHLAAALSAIVSLCGWWYLRNAILLGNPFYPMNLHGEGMGFMAGSGPFSPVNALLNWRKWAWLYLRDPGIGTHDGGFGLIFWGFGTVSWLVVLCRSLLSPSAAERSKLLVWLQMIPGLAVILLVPEHEFPFAVRFSIFVVAIGLLAFGELLSSLESKVYRTLLQAVCIVFALHSVILLSSARSPVYRLARVWADRRQGLAPSEFRYYRDTYPALARWSHAWEPFDLLTRRLPEGGTCYLAAPKNLFLTAPLYGSRLQNRVWNFSLQPDVPPDAFAYHFGEQGEIWYLGRRVTMGEVAADPGYTLVSSSPEQRVFLFVAERLLQETGARRDLADYYARTWPAELIAARGVGACLAEGLPVVTVDRLGYGLLAGKLEGRLGNEVLLAPPGLEGRLAEGRGFAACYSIGAPLAGYNARELPCAGARLYRNDRVRVNGGGG